MLLFIYFVCYDLIFLYNIYIVYEYNMLEYDSQK